MIRKLLLALGAVALIAGTSGQALAGATPAQKCALKKIKAAAKKVQLKLNCYAKAAVKGTVDPKCLAKAEAKFNKLFDKAENKGGCFTTGDKQAIEDKIDAFVADVVAELPSTVPPACPQSAGQITLTQTAGGTLKVDGLPAFPFPAGGTIVADVSAGDANCVHDVVVPFPGGFSAPAFCVPGLGFSVSLAQTGCGVGLLDSDGGSDFTVTELGDTSSPNVCGLGHPGCSNGADSSVQVDVTVGDGAADACASGTAGQALVSIPVHTVTWLEHDSSCPANDGTFDPGQGDILIVEFDQILDFTTDTNSADWADLDPDGCCIAGAGPGSVTNPCAPGGTGGLASTGVCIDTGLSTVTTAASGPIGSAGGPLFDLTFTTVLPNTIAQTGPFQGLTCSPAPVIDLSARGAPGSKKATRCIP